MADEITILENGPEVALKRRKLFDDGATIIAKVADAQWIQGQYSPGVAVEYKTVFPEVGYTIRTTAWLSTAKKDGSYFVRNYGELDLIQRAALSDVEFFQQDDRVDPASWIGRPIAFVVEQKSYENEDGDEVFTNVIKEGTTRRPTDDELAELRRNLAGTGILADTDNGKKELAAAEVVEEDDDVPEVPF